MSLSVFLIDAFDFRQLTVLDLIESEVTDDAHDWIAEFPEDKTCLESLIFDCVECGINFEALERLVARSPSLKKLKLNRHVSIAQLYRLMTLAPQLTHLGTGSFSPSDEDDQEPDYASAFAACKSLVCLSGFRDIVADYLPAIYPVCSNLTSLNLSYANINPEQFRSVIVSCHKLQTLWVCVYQFVVPLMWSGGSVTNHLLNLSFCRLLCRFLIPFVMKDFRQWLQHARTLESFEFFQLMHGKIVRVLYLKLVFKQFLKVAVNLSRSCISASE